jgi:hypothetical protein
MGGDLKRPLSALVVGLNEAEILGPCLDSLHFCDEILYLDLGSTDSSVFVATERRASVHSVNRHPAVEAVVAENIHLIKNRWVLLIDPDERISEGLAKTLCELSFSKLSDQGFAAISVPWQFYFKSKKLMGTPWGGLNSKAILFDTSKCKFVEDVHRGKELKEGARELTISPVGSGQLTHLWFRSWKKAFEKHLRYAKLERAKNSIHWTFELVVKLCFEWPKRFIESYISCRGYRDLWTGFSLSLLWATYHTLILMPRKIGLT